MVWKRKSSRYSDALNQPISPMFNGILISRGFDRYILAQWSKKLILLLKHYEIEHKEPQCWRELAFFLALDHVRGMRVIDEPSLGKGAPRKRTFRRDREIVEVIDQIKGERGRGAIDAIRISLKRGRLKGSVRGLERRYYEAKQSVHRLDEFMRGPPPMIRELSEIYPSLTTGVHRDAVSNDILRFSQAGRTRPPEKILRQIKEDVKRALKMQIAVLKRPKRLKKSARGRPKK